MNTIRIIRDAFTGRFTRKDRLESAPTRTVDETRHAWRAAFLSLADELEGEGHGGCAHRIRKTERGLR